MPRDNTRKIKLLRLLDFLQKNSDESHPITTNQLCSALQNMGIPCDRRTLSQDVVTLNAAGYEIMSTMIGHEKGYYVSDRRFSVPELKILIDAVQAAAFITEGKSQELIEKIADLAGTYRSDVLKRNMVCFNTRKHTNEKVFYNVDVLEEAVQSNRKVIFLYYDLNENREKVYRRDGHHYVVEPVGLVFNEDNYYLMAYSSRHGNTCSYRVDRMEAVEIIEEQICEKVIDLRSTLSEHTEQTFKMFAGPTEDIVLQFPPKLIGSVYDKFGEETPMLKSGDKIIATVKVQVSPLFYGWIYQFGGEMRVMTAEQYEIDGNNVSISGVAPFMELKKCEESNG